MSDDRRDEEYRALARQRIRHLQDVSIGPWAPVQRMADGGAYVEAQIWISPSTDSETIEYRREAQMPFRP